MNTNREKPVAISRWIPDVGKLGELAEGGVADSARPEVRHRFWEEFERLHRERLDHYLANDFRIYREATGAPDGMLMVFVSGGLDSACALAFAVRYASSRGKPSGWVKVVHFVRKDPYSAEKADTESARSLCAATGVVYEEHDITPVLAGLRQVLPEAGPDILADERIARARALVAHTLADYDGALVVDSRNLTEHFLAQWTTGMFTGQFSLIGELFKSETVAFAEAMESLLGRDGHPAMARALSEIEKRDKSSSELRDGTRGPTRLGDYEWLDGILHGVLAGTPPEKLVEGLPDARSDMAMRMLCRMRVHRHRDHSGSPVAEMSGNRVAPEEQYRERLRRNPLARVLDAWRRKRWSVGNGDG